MPGLLPALSPPPSDLKAGPAALLAGCRLPEDWRGQAQWCVLDTGLGEGLNLLATWAAWRRDPERPRRLHLVALEPGELKLAPLQSLSLESDLAPLARELALQGEGLLPGVHRLVFEAGAVHLTLCIGQPASQLRELDLLADSIFLNVQKPVDAHWLKALARCCKRGTRLAGPLALGTEDMRPHGFQVDAPYALPDGLQARFDPPWQPRRNSQVRPPGVGMASTASCLIVGAGLAGAACAASLARRGWQVTVLDRCGPAAGASGLPAGILAPHVSPDDSPISRLSRAGLRATWLEARRLLTPGQDWAVPGVLQRRLPDDGDGGTLPPDWPEAGRHWSQEARTLDGVPAQGLEGALWHPSAGWIKPARLIQAWLNQPGVTVRSGVDVGSLHRLPDGLWQARDASGQCVGQACLLLLATAHHTDSLLRPLLGRSLGLQPVRGQVSWGLSQPGDALPPFPVNGHGSLVCYPGEGGPAWLLGATFERDDVRTDVRAAGHAEAFGKLKALLPETAASLAGRFQAGAVNGWAGVRCASRDHLPVVGPVAEELPGLWLCTAFGSRGLSYSAMCGELIAAWLHGEPLPLEARLVRALQASRLLRRR